MSRNIKCDECNSFLFSTDKESDGAAGSEAQRMGFVFKMPFLLTDKYGCLFFCDKDCTKAFYDRNIPKSVEMSKKINEMKAELPEAIKKTTKAMARFCDALNSIKKQYNGN